MTTPLDIAREAWGDSLPGWVERLARECEASTQNKVATRLGRSASLVSAVLRKLQLSSRYELTAWASARRLL